MGAGKKEHLTGRTRTLHTHVPPSHAPTGHHLFLYAMERLDRGGGRVRLRPRRRHDEEDFVLRALRAGKVLLLAWAAGRTLGAVLCGKSH